MARKLPGSGSSLRSSGTTSGTVRRNDKSAGYALTGALALLCLGLAGCNGASAPSSLSLEDSVAGPPSQSSSQMMALSPTTESHAPAQPIAALPAEAGAVASVRSHDYVNGFRQDVLMKGNAIRAIPNSLTILARSSHQATLDEATPLFKPSEPAIRAELAKQFPHISMQVVDRPSSNLYGPYGLALGRGEGNVHCIYMWQWIDENRIPQGTGLNGPMSLRVRLCQANTTFDAMAALADHLTIGRDAGASTDVASSDTSGVVSGPTDTDTPKAAPRRHVKHVMAHRAKATAVAKRDPVGDEPSLVIPQALPQPSATGPVVPVALSTDLPAQAYLGPGAVKRN